MRLLLAFLIGLLAFFFIGELFNRLKMPFLSLYGIVLIIIGFLLGFLGHYWLAPPLDILASLFILGAGLGLTFHHLLSRRYIVSERLERNFVSSHENLVERLLEILPGLLTWIALTSPFWLSFTLPFAVAYLIIIADTYWLINSLKIAVCIYLGYRKYDWAKKQPWLEKLKSDFPKDWDKYTHLVLLPTYKEGLNILSTTLQGILNTNYPKDKIYLIVGYEERDDKEKIEEVNSYLKVHFGGKIGGVFTTIHPFGLPGEVPGQGSNKNWMINQTIDDLRKKGLKEDEVFVTTLDADFVIHEEFLAGALHKYLSTPEKERDRSSYTGVFLYYNNYWQAPTFTRLVATGTSFWQMAEMVGSDKYQNYSSMSINLKSLLDIGLWIPNKVNDDSGFYWKAYFHFKGDYKVIPHFLPISADTVLDVNIWKTFQNQYLQLKRWAYGVEHIPYVFKEYFKSDIDFWNKTDKLLFVLWANLKWGTLALFVTFAGLFIPYINPYYGETAVSINLPIISSWILTVAFLGLTATIYVHEKTAPKRPKNWSLIKKVWSYIQWLLVPIVLVTISTFPAIHAQTALMFGRYMEFRVTNKARRES
jgi:hypothetical protein